MILLVTFGAVFFELFTASFGFLTVLGLSVLSGLASFLDALSHLVIIEVVCHFGVEQLHVVVPSVTAEVLDGSLELQE